MITKCLYRISQSNKAERLREAFYSRRKRMYGHLSKEDALVNALVRAAIHARTCVVNSKLISPANVRAGQFVTSLRRELRDTVPYHVKHITETSKWSDILELNPKCGHDDDITKAVNLARARINNRSHAEVINEGLTQINNDISAAFSTLSRIEEINVEANIILNDFKELAKNL